LVVELTPEQLELVELATRVSAADIPVANRVLQALIDNPLPADDAELRPEVIESIVEARASIARGEFASHEEIMREFGLKSD
jgi:hypothetical protein